MSPPFSFHPAVAAWFERSFAAPTAAQAEAWPAIQAGRHVLIAAPTGSGKTLAAFLAAIDGLVRQGLAGDLADETQIVYVSPLKALSNDIQRNLEAPLAGIREALREQGLPDVEIRTWVRTGDTPPGERQRMRRRPPHIVVTTPESLYILLGSDSGREMLATTRTVIVDEIHARGRRTSAARIWRSRSSGSRRSAATELLRIGLSATQKPIEAVARFLVGAAGGRVPRSSTPATAARATSPLEVPSSPLEAVMSGEVWRQVYDRLAELIEAHRTTLVFVNTRRMAERVTRQLSERLGADQVTAHHGSLAKEQRLDAEQRLKRGALKALVATASLELGIDIGEVDLVCQLGSPRSIATLPAARRPLRPCGRRHAQGPPLPAVARRAGRMRGAARQRPPRRARPADDPRAAARRAGPADRRRGRGAGMERGRRSSRCSAAPGPTATCRARISTRSWRCWPKASPPGAAGAAR